MFVLFLLVMFSVVVVCALAAPIDESHSYSGGFSGGYTSSARENNYNRNHRNSFRSKREDKMKSDQKGYREGMRDAIWGDGYHYITGHQRKSEAYKSGYTRGYEQNLFCDEDF